MRVFVVIDSFSFGGAERLLATLTRAAPGAGLELRVASLAAPSSERAGMLPALEAAGLDVEYVGVRRLADRRAVARLVSAIRASACDVVHAHLEYAATLVPVAARIARLPAVCTFHHVPTLTMPAREAVKERLSVAAAARTGATIFVSEASMRGFSRRYRRRPNWQVVRNGIDLSEFSPRTSELPGDLGVPVGAQVVAFVAAMRAPKGHADAVAAWPAVLARAPQARLLLVGSGPEEGRLREQVTALGLQERVVFAGVRSDIAGILRASSLALLTSETEALPTTLIEAAACGRAAVAISVGGVPEVVEHGRNGLLVERGNVDGIASAVADLLLDDDRREAMGLAGRDLALERFDMHGWARSLRSVYDRARAGRPALR